MEESKFGIIWYNEKGVVIGLESQFTYNRYATISNACSMVLDIQKANRTGSKIFNGLWYITKGVVVIDLEPQIWQRSNLDQFLRHQIQPKCFIYRHLSKFKL